MQSLPSNTQIPSSTAFAQNGDKSDIVASSDRDMNWSSGFPAIFSRLLRDGGKYVKREDMNAILFALSNEALYRQWGGLVSYNASVSNTIFGYPVGATLIYKNPQTGALSFIESQVANNQIPPSSATIDTKTDINGQYADNGVVRWKTVLSNEGQTVPYINVPILTPMWFDHKVSNPEWIESEMEYTINNNYGWITQGSAPKIFEHLRGDVSTATSKTETVAGVTITYYESEDKHKIVVANGEAWDGTSYQKYANAVDSIFEKTGIAWYYILDETNGCFRLPRTKFQSFSLGNSVTVPVVGNGLALGLTDGATNIGTVGQRNGLTYSTAAYGAAVGTAVSDGTLVYTALGVTKDPNKSGLIASGTLKSETDANFYLYFCATEYVSSSGGGGSGGVIDGTLLVKEEGHPWSFQWSGSASGTVQKVYTVRNDCGLGIMEPSQDQAYSTAYYLDKACTQPIWKHSESYAGYAETLGTIVPLKKGSEIYMRMEPGNQSIAKTINFFEYALVSIAPQIAMPDYNSTDAQTIDTTQFTAPENGWICCNPTYNLVSIKINNILVSRAMAQVAGGNFSWSGTIVPISKGDIATFSSADELKFIPCKTVQQSTPPAYITRYGRNASTGYWYRIYSDGFCEQGGTATSFPGGGAGSVELPVSYADTNYQAFADYMNFCSSKLKGSFTLSAPGDWHTMGYVF